MPVQFSASHGFVCVITLTGERAPSHRCRTEKEIGESSGQRQRGPMWHTLKRAVVVLREEGLRKFLLRALDWAEVYRRVVLMSRPLDEPIPEITLGLPVVIDLLQESEIDEYLAFRPDASPNDIRSRLRSGQLCFTVRYEGKIINAGWATTGPVWNEYVEHEISLPSDGFYHYDVFTLPSFRCRNVETARIAEMLRHFRNRGYRLALAIVIPENVSGLRPMEKCGYSPSGMLGLLRLGPLRHNFGAIHLRSLLSRPSKEPQQHNAF